MVLQDAVQMEMALASLSCNRKQETNSKKRGGAEESLKPCTLLQTRSHFLHHSFPCTQMEISVRGNVQ